MSSPVTVTKEDVLRLADKAIREHPTCMPNSDPRFPPSLYYRFLYWLADFMRPEFAVELGVCGGGGVRALALGAGMSGTVIGCDVDKYWHERMEQLLREHHNFQYWFRDSVVAATDFFRRHPWKFVDILFIDTTHTRERTLQEFEAWHPILAPGAVVILDDIERKEMDNVHLDLPGEWVSLHALHDTHGFGCLLGCKER